MKRKYHFKKFITIFTIFILLSSFNMIFSVTGEFNKKNNEGLWFDEFEDLKNVTLDNCDNESGNIILNQSEENLPFDYNSYPDNVNVWYHKSYIPDSSLLKALSRFITPSLLPGTEALESEKEKIGQLDGLTLETEAVPIYPYDFTGPREHPMHHFRFEIPDRSKDSETIDISWWFGDYKSSAHLDSITMYIWKYGDIIPIWGGNETIEYTEGNIANPNDAPDLSITIDVNEDISDEGYIDVLIIATPNTEGEYSYLYTDYINVSIISKYGYVSEGYATSDLINPDNLGRWDRIIWTGSNPSSKSNISIQILDKNDEIINGYESKYSPLDISTLDKEITEIKIKATLRSSSVDVSPRLDSWAALYYKEDNYVDSFSNEYRIDETKGVIVDTSNENIQLSNFYSSWPIFGKNPANTRSYDGETLKEPKKEDDYYWYSDSGFVGGQFRGPVVSDGKVYVASLVDKRIYAFDEIAVKKGEKQDYTDRSDNSYIVSSPVAVSDDYVIFGTNNEDLNNNVYFLNKTDLKDESWSYEPQSPTCFASAPVVDEGRVFITSWSGYGLDFPLLSSLFSYFVGNSKLFAIDILSQDDIWDPIDLPASSFSTPAIGENKVFVACQDMYGSNLFSYDIFTGEENWNISVGSPYGIIGRSSPLYADGKVFVLCNERKEITDFGTNKLFAVDASNGDMLWNKSLGNATIPTLINLIINIPSSAPVSTPAFYDDTLYVLSPAGQLFAFQSKSGKKVWSYDFSNDTILPETYITSPIVVDDKVYVITGNTINCLNRQNGQKSWSFDIKKPVKAKIEPGPPSIFASPVIADGLMFISGTRNSTANMGHIYCYGNYTPNSFGYAKSTLIIPPEGYWWNNFSADVENSTKNNTLLFDILNEEGVVIDGFEDLNGSNNPLSGVNSNKIKLYAKFNIGEYNDPYPTLKSWEVDWVEEKGIPFFDYSDTGGWVNKDLPDYWVTAEDKSYNGVLSGLDSNSAKYKISYIPTGKSNYISSEWIDANCSSPSGSKKTTVTAELSKSNLNIKDVKNITFMISDLAGNTNDSYPIPLDSDMKTPYSIILNKASLEDKYYFNSETDNLTISADAQDTGGSDLRKVILKYRYSKSSDGNWSNWTDYQESDSYFKWDFGLNNHGGFLKSGFYQIVTVAIDRAGNTEAIKDEKIVEICFDMNPPTIETKFNDLYESEDPPLISFDVSDDLNIDSVFYSLDSDDSWNLIQSNINEENTSIRWSVPKEYWIGIREEEEHTIYFNITDICRNKYITTTDESPIIKKNKNATTRYLDITSFSEWNWGDTFKISTQNLPDDINISSIKLLFKYSKDNQTWDEQWTVYDGNKTEAPYEWDFTPPEEDGYYKFFLEIEDIEGYRYTSSIESVKINVFPLIETLLFISVFILLLVISLYIIRKFKSKKL